MPRHGKVLAARLKAALGPTYTGDLDEDCHEALDRLEQLKARIHAAVGVLTIPVMLHVGQRREKDS